MWWETWPSCWGRHLYSPKTCTDLKEKTETPAAETGNVGFEVREEVTWVLGYDACFDWLGDLGWKPADDDPDGLCVDGLSLLAGRVASGRLAEALTRVVVVVEASMDISFWSSTGLEAEEEAEESLPVSVEKVLVWFSPDDTPLLAANVDAVLSTLFRSCGASVERSNITIGSAPVPLVVIMMPGNSFLLPYPIETGLSNSGANRTMLGGSVISTGAEDTGGGCWRWRYVVCSLSSPVPSVAFITLIRRAHFLQFLLAETV